MKPEAALRALREALRENEVYPAGHDQHYRRVIKPIEEVGIACKDCGALIDASDVLDFMLEEGAQAGPEQALALTWECVDCAEKCA